MPRQEFVELCSRVTIYTVEYVGEPSFGVDVVELSGCGEGVDRGGSLAAAVGATERPIPAPERNTAQRPLGSISIVERYTGCQMTGAR